MVAIVTLGNALNIANQLAAKDGEKLFRQMRERRRRAWLAEFEAASRQALEDLRAGRLKALSTPEEIRQHLNEIWKSDNA